MTHMQSISPRVSVIMPVYNVQAYVAKSIASILDQTFADFEFLIVDDGSTDNTPEIVRTFTDKRIRFFQKPHMGYVYHLNYGLAEARGEFIARQDGDDWSHPERFEKQVAFLESQPEYALVSSDMRLVDEQENSLGLLEYPTEPNYDMLIKRCCISHPVSMWRREVHERIGGYDEQFNKNCCEDYDLWLRMADYYRFYVLGEPLYMKREHAQSSIALNRWTYVPIYDDLARSRAKMRRIQLGAG